MQSTLSNKEKKYIEKTVRSYEEKSITKLEELRALDNKVKRGPRAFAYILGSIGSLVLGFGMSVAMKVILADLMIMGLVIGVLGLILVIINYPIYQKNLKKSKNKYASRIIELSSSLLNE